MKHHSAIGRIRHEIEKELERREKKRKRKKMKKKLFGHISAIFTFFTVLMFFKGLLRSKDKKKAA